MKKLLAMAVLILITFSAFANERDVVWHGKDKPIHFFGSAIFGGFINYTLPDDYSESERLMYGTMIGTVPGLIREISKNKNFSLTDLAYDIMGSLFGNMVVETNIRIQLIGETKNHKDKTLMLTYTFYF